MRAQFRVTFCPEREQARLQREVGTWFSEHWAPAGSHLWTETSSVPSSEQPPWHPRLPFLYGQKPGEARRLGRERELAPGQAESGPHVASSHLVAACAALGVRGSLQGRGSCQSHKGQAPGGAQQSSWDRTRPHL